MYNDFLGGGLGTEAPHLHISILQRTLSWTSLYVLDKLHCAVAPMRLQWARQWVQWVRNWPAPLGARETGAGAGATSAPGALARVTTTS